MNIVLVDSSAFPSSWLGLNCFIPPLGLLNLASSVRDIADKIRIFDDRLPNEKQLREADVLGIRMMSADLPYGLDLLQKAKQINPNIKTMVGGFHVTTIPESVDKDFVDHIVIREGDKAFRDIILGKVNDKIVEYPLLENLDDLPFPAYDLINTSKYHLFGMRTISMETSRGCPYSKCNFCCIRAFYKDKFRWKSVSRVIDDLIKLEKYNPNAIHIIDDNHTGNVKRAMQLCDAIREYGLDYIHYTCLARVDTLAKHPELVKRMADAGYFGIFMGAESPYQSSLDTMNKGVTWEQTKQAVKLCNEYGILSFVSMIIGTPNETEEMVKSIPHYLRELSPSSCSLFMFQYHPYSLEYEEMKRNGDMLVEDLKYYNGTICLYNHPRIDPRRLNELYIDVSDEYYTDIKNYLPMIPILLRIGARIIPRRIRFRVNKFLSILKQGDLLQSNQTVLESFTEAGKDVYDGVRLIRILLGILKGKTNVSKKYVDEANQIITESLNKK